DITYFHNPLWYIVSTFCMAAGTFLIWFRVFYWLATPKGKVLFDKLVWIFSGVMITNYMFFGNNLGIISPSLKYEDGLNFSKKEQIINIVVIFVVVVVFYFIVTKWSKLATGVLLSAVIALGAMSAVNIVKINASINSINISDTSSTPHFKLSKEGQNVVVLLLDRAMGEFVPYIINEKPELKEQFDGFTYYSNTISHGGFTNFCAPSVLGGYEYTPVELNKRDSELLVDKHNEALKVMPKLFNTNNYEVTVCDAPYANYKPIADLSIYNDTPEINKYLTKGKFSDETQKAQSIAHNHRNFFCFSLMKTLPVSLQSSLYQEGMYRRLFYANDTNYSTPNIKSRSVAVGYDKSFMNSYDVLKNLNNITEISNHNENTFLFLYNDLTHDPILLQTPEYEPEYEVDNTKYDAEHADRFTVNGNSINMDNLEQLMHYHCNMGAFVQIGKWLDYLKENDVYDNTRIIIVSDHGKPIKCMDSLILDDGTDEYKNVEYYYPLFLVKDFNATGFTTSDEFMTNADVPYLATKDLIENPVNPFTGKEISIDEKTSHEQLVIMSDYWGVDLNNGYTFFPAKWASVSENLWDKNNWKFYDEKIVLKDYKLPES
ncbi:MAG: sulfatase-like hydrolase/transferase, partial [Acutalibacteraceae bacterium]|nr:sulfatase-like hydrolase/transferase [Acutalibacteraceae bacterium]